jgi:hypothetical protein
MLAVAYARLRTLFGSNPAGERETVPRRLWPDSRRRQWRSIRSLRRSVKTAVERRCPCGEPLTEANAASHHYAREHHAANGWSSITPLRYTARPSRHAYPDLAAINPAQESLALPACQFHLTVYAADLLLFRCFPLGASDTWLPQNSHKEVASNIAGMRVGNSPRIMNWCLPPE